MKFFNIAKSTAEGAAKGATAGVKLAAVTGLVHVGPSVTYDTWTRVEGNAFYDASPKVKIMVDALVTTIITAEIVGSLVLVGGFAGGIIGACLGIAHEICDDIVDAICNENSEELSASMQLN